MNSQNEKDISSTLYGVAGIAVQYCLSHQKDFERGLDLILKYWDNFSNESQENIRRRLAEITDLGHDFVRKHEDKINRVRERTARP